MSIFDELQVRVGYDYDAEPKETLACCPLCGGEKLRPFLDRERCGYRAPSQLCEECTLVFLNPRMTREGYRTFYERWYRKIILEAYGISGRDENPRHYSAQICDFVEGVAGHPCRRRALDVGGSVGGFADELKARWQYECTVLDPCAAELDEAAEKGHQTIHGLIEDAPLGGPYDLIGVLRAVDHFLDPVGALARLHGVLQPHGLLVIDVVNHFQTIKQVTYREGAIKIDHPMNFTATTAQVLLLRSGFEPLELAATADKKHILALARPVPLAVDAYPEPDVIAETLTQLDNWANGTAATERLTGAESQ